MSFYGHLGWEPFVRSAVVDYLQVKIHCIDILAWEPRRSKLYNRKRKRLEDMVDIYTSRKLLQ